MKRIALMIIIFHLSSFATINAQGWTELRAGDIPGRNGDIYTTCADKIGNVYAAGWFNDDCMTSSVYKWNGTEWIELGCGSTALDSSWNIQVSVILADSAGNVYAEATKPIPGGGAMSYVAKWDGTSWSQLGTGSDALYCSDIAAIALDRFGNLYAAGNFNDPDGSTYVAKWNGTSWSEVGTGSSRLHANGFINTLYIDSSNNIFAAGAFTDATSDTSGNLFVAKWDGTSWTELGSGICPQMYDDAQIFTVVGDDSGNIYAAGYFTFGPPEYVAKWDGTSWQHLGTGFNAVIFSLCTDKFGNLYAAGEFTDTTVAADPTLYYTYTRQPAYVAKWDGTAWSKLGSGINALNANNEVMSICSDPHGNIYAAGGFTDTTIAFHQTYVAKYTVSTSGISPAAVNSKISVFPNPADDNINIMGVTEKTCYTLINATGITIQKGLLDKGSNTLSMKNYASGLYLLQMKGNSDLKQTIRIIKN